MDRYILVEVIAFVGGLSALALYLGYIELATAGVGGLIGFLGNQMLSPEQVKE